MLGTLALASVLLAQGPAPAGDPAAEAREAKHLRNIRQVTSGLLKAGEGYFSPDARSIIYQGVRPGTEDYQIFTQDLAPGSTPKMVSTGKGKCTCAYFHPDGKSILFASSHLDPALSSDGTKPAEPPKAPGYQREGRSYRWDFEPAMDLFRADLDGSNLIRLTATPGYDAEGSYSPDGKQIVFTSFRDGDPEVYVMDADGTNPRRVTNIKGYDGGPFFAPDGKRLVYRSDRKGNDLLQVFVNNTAGTAERPLTDDTNVNWGPYWHPDGKHVIYATSRFGHTNYDLMMVDAETGAEERITFVEGFDGLPVFSPDGSKLMWTSSGRTPDHKSQLFVADFVLGAAPTVDQ